MSGKRKEERTGRREGPRETENPVLQHCGLLMFHHHRMLPGLLFRQMFQKHSETQIYPPHLCGVGIEEDRRENAYCCNKLGTRVFFPERCEAQRTMKQASFLTPLVAQSSPKGLERSDKVPAQFYISLQVLQKKKNTWIYGSFCENLRAYLSIETK